MLLFIIYGVMVFSHSSTHTLLWESPPQWLWMTCNSTEMMRFCMWRGSVFDQSNDTWDCSYYKPNINPAYQGCLLCCHICLCLFQQLVLWSCMLRWECNTVLQPESQHMCLVLSLHSSSLTGEQMDQSAPKHPNTSKKEDKNK